PTSIAVATAVLDGKGANNTPTGRVTLGAAVIDDVLVLLLLTVFSIACDSAGSGSSGDTGTGQVVLPIVFLLIIIAFGERACWIVFRKFAAVSRWFGADRETMYAVPGALTVMFGFAGLASLCGLEPIIGAFFAGVHFAPRHLLRSKRQLFEAEAAFHQLEVQLEGLVKLGAIFFFVLVGARVDLSLFGDPSVILLGGLTTVAALLGKAVCYPFLKRGAVDRVAVCFAMMCRGEVVLVFAEVGRTIVLDGTPLIDERRYGALVVAVVCCAVVGPLALHHRLEHHHAQRLERDTA
ncbi:MAG: cation:proton antiporter, partial [Bdellovibrionales bacterium]|nr:cation:proton antiporter [Bdellovibrionales bacterium]